MEKTHLEMLSTSLLATFLENNGNRLDEVAVKAGKETYTKQELGDDAIRFAGWLLESGLSAGDKIAVIGPNSYEGIAAIIGANAIGIQVAALEPIDETDVEPFYKSLDNHRPEMVLFYDRPAAWMSAVKSYASYIKVFLVVKSIESFTRQHFGFKNIISRAEFSFENTIREIEKYRSSNGHRLMLHYQDYSWVPLLSSVISGNPIILAEPTMDDMIGYRKLQKIMY